VASAFAKLVVCEMGLWHREVGAATRVHGEATRQRCKDVMKSMACGD
jgi:hypothetical protein